jgi:hypothetical protein
MMHPCASAAKLRGGGPILRVGVEAMGRRGSPPPRIVFGGSSAEADGRQNYFAISIEPTNHYADRRVTPCGMSPVVTNRHSAMRSLRASATTMVLRFFPEATLA